MANHEFILPEEKMVVEVGEIVEFDVTSIDLTYGFGLFREDQFHAIPDAGCTRTPKRYSLEIS